MRLGVGVGVRVRVGMRARGAGAGAGGRCGGGIPLHAGVGSRPPRLPLPSSMASRPAGRPWHHPPPTLQLKLYNSTWIARTETSPPPL